MFRLALTGFILLFPSLALAGTITIAIDSPTVTMTLNAQKDQRLTRLKDKNNAATGQSQTTNQYIQDVITAVFTGKDKELSAAEEVDACTTFNALPAAQQATALTTYFGNKNPCP